MMVRPRGAMKPAVSSSPLVPCSVLMSAPGVFSVQCDASGATWRAYPGPVRLVVW